MMTTTERQQVLVEWNRTARDYPRDKCVHQLFEEQVERTPDAVAVVFEERSITYRELNARANQLGHHLRSLGIGPDVLVGLCVERSLEMVVALLGILKAGGAYVPLDPHFPERRLRFILEDTGLRVLLTCRTCAWKPSVVGLALVHVEDFVHRDHLGDAVCLTRPENLAYIIYTSGSTGAPKGVAIEHHSAVSFLHWVREIFTDEELSGVLFATSICFDLSVFEVFGPLCWGGKIILVESALDVGSCRHRQEVKLLNTVPSVMRTILGSHAMPASVVTVNLAGEPLQPSLVDAIYAFPHIKRVNDLYGPSETTIYSTWATRVSHKPATIGRPIANTKVYILDALLQPVPLGKTGELWIGGEGVARGYLNRPELTAERFITDPFGSEAGARIYKTGDLARHMPDGDIEFLGRIDFQVKIRGYRVELGEIEAVLGGHPELPACAVVARNEAGGDSSLAAFLVARGSAAPSVASLRAWLAEKLPDHMIPSRFLVLPALPLTPNGKVDRKALGRFDGAELASGTDHVPPRTELESELVGIWTTVLRRERIGIRDNFFDLGGHSLLAVAVCSQITRQLHVEVPLRWLFEHPTIERLTTPVDFAVKQSALARPIEKADRQQPLPMSFAQQRMWLLQQTLPDPATYNQPVAFRLSGRVDRGRGRRALQVMMERHEVLRTALVREGHCLLDKIAGTRALPLPWQESDLSAIPSDQQETALAERLVEEARRPFDLARAPLWRALWITLGDKEHVLECTFHHSIVDEWSLRLFFQEWARLYETDACLGLAGLPELPVQYADYAVWQRGRLTGDLLAQQRAYWQKQLEDLPPPLELPIDRSPPARLSGSGARHGFAVGENGTTRLRELAREEGTTLFTVMLAAFLVWLHRITGQPDVVVGTPVADRNRPEIQSLLGFFLNTVPIRVRLEGGPTFRDVVRQVREALLGAFSHADLPFEQMVEMAVKDRTPGHQPLHQVMFVLLEEGLPAFRLDQAEARSLPATTRTSKNDLTLSIEATAEAMTCHFEYATDLFTAETAARMSRHLTELLRSITADTEKSIGQLNLMPAEERQQVLVGWNRTQRDHPRDKCVHQLFEEQVERTPEAVAVLFEEQSLTYRELNARANRLGHHLRSLGVGTDVLVGLCVERSLEMVVGVLGILKAGAAYVPVDPSYPKDRLAYMIKDNGSPWLVTQTALASRLPESVAKTICLEHLPDGLGEQNLSISVSPQNLAYVLYTSGSTGQPKGVAMEHGPLVNLLCGEASRSGVGRRTLQFAALNFDVSFQELFSTWLSGGTLQLIDSPTRLDPAALWELIARQRLERLFLPVVMLRQLVEAASCSPQKAPALCEIITAGEQLCITSAIRGFFTARPGLTLHNHYGPTESHVVTTWTLPGLPESWPEFPPIGTPIANTSIYVLDPNLDPVAVGTPGELYIGGAALARGYLNQPEKTAERFLRDPFVQDPQARLYRTGDRARHRPDGVIEYLGRLDHQVKIRGFRIELGEVEAVLGGHPEVSACAVAAQSLDGTDKVLAAFVVARAPAAPTAGSLRRWLVEKLPDHMVPSRFLVLAALPLTPNGKVDRKALETLEGVESAPGTGYAAPRTELERKLAEIWQAVLRRERVGLHDNFFDLGGHSLLAVATIARINRGLDMDVPLRWFLDHPTIEGLAETIASSGTQAQGTHAIERIDRERPLLVSYGQRAMWLLQQLSPDPATYHVPVAFRLTGRVDRERTKRCLQVIVRRHEILRTALVRRGEEPEQHVAESGDLVLPWQEVDLQRLPPHERESALAEQLEATARQPFDLAQAPLWRGIWIQISAVELVLALTFHHAVVDEWSLRLFLREWERLYSADGEEAAAGLPELPVQYADFAAWQRRKSSWAALEKLRGYWRAQLHGLPRSLDLPTDFPRPVRPGGRGAVHPFTVTGPVVARLREIAREEGTTLFTVLLAAYQVWLHRYTGQTDLVVGTPVADRNRPEIQSLLGFFLNTLPIRGRLEGDPGFRTVLRQVRESLLEAFSHADLPFEQMVELAAHERIPGHQALYQSMFVLLEEGLPDFRLDQAQARPLPVETRTSKNDLILAINAKGDTLECSFEYPTDLFTAETAARMGRHLAALLQSIATDPEKPISRLNLMPDGERQQVLVEWNRTARDYPRDKCVHQLFEEQVERTPDAVAVVFEERSLTYRELNARANQLGHHLRSLGVGPDVLVGLCVERSLEMVVALLGILKAGGAYVPLDPHLPRERLAFLIQDVDAPLVLLQQRWRDILPVPPAGTRTRLLALEELPALLADAPRSNPSRLTTPDHLAYVLYTSGSTGTPKGVEIPHMGIVRLVIRPDYVALTSQDVLLQFAPLAFDASTFEIWGSLLNGAQLVVCPARQLDYTELGRLITTHGVTTLWLTAALFHEMLAHSPTALAGVRQLLAGGDVLSPSKVRAYLELPGHGRLINGYGPTENTTFSCCCGLDRAEQVGASVPIGRAIAGTRVHLLDPQGSAVPSGVVGELCVGGDGLARGYHNRPELTAERFIADPFSSDPGARLYKTGDLARRLPDGDIEFLGRIDFQVKIRGYRIELGEIEAVLGGHPGLAACSVAPKDRGGGDKTLTAFLVTRDQASLSVASLRAWLAEKLPDHMVPSRFLVLPALPLTPNGKVDRKALERFDGAELTTGTDHVPPRTELESKLVEIWKTVLRRERIGIRDNFFDLGGHSLQAVKLTAEIETLLGHTLAISMLFQAPTVESLALRITEEDEAPARGSLVPLQTKGSKPPLFFIHGMGGDVYCFLAVARQLAPEQPVYGLQGVGLDGKTARHTSVEQMAAHYAQEIRDLQPEGPYHLVGYSVGGIIAFETAKQLHGAGQKVAMLGLLDTYPTRMPTLLYLRFYIPNLILYLLRRPAVHLRRWWKLSPDDRSRYLRGRWLMLRHWFGKTKLSGSPAGAPSPQTDDPLGVILNDHYVATALTYRVRPYPGSVDLFSCDESLPGISQIWRRLAQGGATLHRLSGGHRKMIDADRAPAVAKSLRAALQRADERREGP